MVSLPESCGPLFKRFRPRRRLHFTHETLCIYNWNPGTCLQWHAPMITWSEGGKGRLTDPSGHQQEVRSKAWEGDWRSSTRWTWTPSKYLRNERTCQRFRSEQRCRNPGLEATIQTGFLSNQVENSFQLDKWERVFHLIGRSENHTLPVCPPDHCFSLPLIYGAKKTQY